MIFMYDDNRVHIICMICVGPYVSYVGIENKKLINVSRLVSSSSCCCCCFLKVVVQVPSWELPLPSYVIVLVVS